MLRSAKDNSNFLDFCRVARELGARPKMLIRYIRESYFSANDDYARVTFDRRVSYRSHNTWNLAGPELAGAGPVQQRPDVDARRARTCL